MSPHTFIYDQRDRRYLHPVAKGLESQGGGEGGGHHNENEDREPKFMFSQPILIF